MNVAFPDVEPKMVSWLAGDAGSNPSVPETPSEWASFSRVAAETGLAGLMLQRAKSRGIELPATAFRSLKSASGAVAARNIALLEALRRLTTILREAGVDVMLLKGAALHLMLYDRPDERPMSDLDFLVRARHVDRAVAALETAGCHRGFDLIRPDFFPKYYYEVEYLSDSPRPARIDLHVRPFRPLRLAATLPEAAFWRDSIRVDWHGGFALTPAYGTMLLHLAAHAAYHGCDRLIWLYDIKRWVERYRNEIDWARAADDARRWRLSLAVHAAMAKATHVLGDFGASDFMRELAGHRSDWRDALSLAQTPRDAATPLRHVLTNWLTTPGFRFSTGYVLAHVFPGEAHLASLYGYRHAGWRMCAHGWRVLRGLGRLAHSAAGCVVRGQAARPSAELKPQRPIGDPVRAIAR